MLDQEEMIKADGKICGCLVFWLLAIVVLLLHLTIVMLLLHLIGWF